MSNTDKSQTILYGASAISDKNTIYVNYFVWQCKKLFAGDMILFTYTKAWRFCYEFGSSRLQNHFKLTFGIWPRKLLQVERILTLFDVMPAVLTRYVKLYMRKVKENPWKLELCHDSRREVWKGEEEGCMNVRERKRGLNSQQVNRSLKGRKVHKKNSNNLKFSPCLVYF